MEHYDAAFLCSLSTLLQSRQNTFIHLEFVTYALKFTLTTTCISNQSKNAHLSWNMFIILELLIPETWKYIIVKQTEYF